MSSVAERGLRAAFALAEECLAILFGSEGLWREIGSTMRAIAERLARGFTGRDKIIKFEGHYHGHVDSLLVAAGSGALTHGEPDSAGIPRSFAAETITLPFNLPERVEEVFAQ